jgi:glycosyltransferase involved in cell wall biosynthesis
MTAGAGGRARVCVACEVMHPPLDEGIRIYAAHLARELAGRCDLSLLASRDGEVAGMTVRGLLTDRYFRSPVLARHLAGFDPDVVIYVPWTSLTARTLLRVRSLRRAAPRARMGVVALQPRRADLLTRWMARLGRPHRVLAAGPLAQRQAEALGLPVTRVGAGVDLDRFRPVDAAQRAALRQRGGIDPEACVVLHVGHLKSTRNVGVLERLAREAGVRCVLVASTSTGTERALADRLASAGVLIMARHEDRIERVYQLADAYVFPVRSDLDAMEMPLSVLEAAASDLAIVSTPFGGLPGLLDGSPGVRWASGDDEIVEAVRRLAASPRGRAGTRAAVEGRTWSRAADEVMQAVAGR